MPGAGFKTFTAGEVFTATDANTYLMQQAVMVFTNEAARDAAITSPSEGMHAYLTAPTVPAATGGTTAVPSGVQTIYNGSVWVCTTPVGAFTLDTGTSTSLAYTTTLTSGGTNPTVTLVTGTTAMVSFTTRCRSSNIGNVPFCSISVSGATTLAASDDWCTYMDSFVSNYRNTMTRTFIMTGLTAGTNTFALSYKVDANTGTWLARHLVVQGIA